MAIDGLPTIEKRLTEYADCAGCASKFDAEDLSQLMNGLEASADERILVDFRTADDAGVYRWTEKQALVQTVDFFTPIVDDPYLFGQIAAANALSDVYAMGGVPRTALAIAALPKKGPAPDVIRTIFRGGSDMLRQAGVALLGGHTVSDPEVKFGYAITGEVDIDRVLTNAGARPGDDLILTKPLGTGVIVRARKYGQGSDEHLRHAVASMVRLSDTTARVLSELPAGAIGACTDVTGFGLAGHACEVAAASRATLVIDTMALPVLPGALELVRDFLPCGGRANKRHFKQLEGTDRVSPERFMLCLDPQTSGGLLFSVNRQNTDVAIGHLAKEGIDARLIGCVESAGPSETLVRLV